MKKEKIKKWMILLSILTILIIPLSKAKAIVIDNSKIRYVISSDNSVGNWTIPGVTNSLTSPTRVDDELIQIDSTGTGKYISGQLIFTGTLYHHNSATGIGPDITNPTIQCGITNDNSFSFRNYFTLNTNIVYNLRQNNTNSRVPAQYIIIANINGESSIELDTNSKILCRLYNSGSSNGLIKMQTGDAWQQVLNEFTTGNQQIKTQANINVSRDATEAINAFANQNHEDIEDIKNSLAQQWQQEATNWSAFENSDITNEAKQQPSQQNYDTVHAFEEGIFHDLDDPNIISLLDLGIDPETNNWIWTTMTSIFNANARVMSMVLSVLTLGLAKFLMGR